MKIKLLLGASILLLASATSAFGVTLHVDGTGNLFGASGVDVEGKLYDVEFVDGTCIDVFNGCDSSSDFTFGGLCDGDVLCAVAASQALLDQVFIDVGGVLFDSIPWATRGCVYGPLEWCGAYVPYSTTCEKTGTCDNPEPFYQVRGVATENWSTEAYDGVVVGDLFDADAPFDGAGAGSLVWARFEPTVVPVSAAFWLFGTALIGLIGFSKRRKPV